MCINLGNQSDHPSRRAIAIVSNSRQFVLSDELPWISRQDGWSVAVYKCGKKTNYPRKLHLVTRSQRLFSINYQFKIADKAAAWATSVSKLNSSVKRLLDISLFIVRKECSPSSAALLFLEKSFGSCAIAAILKFAAKAALKHLIRAQAFSLCFLGNPFRKLVQ